MIDNILLFKILGMCIFGFIFCIGFLMVCMFFRFRDYKVAVHLMHAVSVTDSMFFGLALLALVMIFRPDFSVQLKLLILFLLETMSSLIATRMMAQVSRRAS